MNVMNKGMMVTKRRKEARVRKEGRKEGRKERKERKR